MPGFMRIINRVIGGLHGLFRKARVEEELDAELHEFLESAVEQKMRAGSSRGEAIRAARMELGSMDGVKDRVRDVGWESVVDSVWQDVRYGSRMLRRSPGFAAVAIGILALGIGANTAIFSVINPLMLRQLPVREPAQLVELLSRYPGEPRMHSFSWKAYEHYRDHNHVFSDLIGVSPSRFQVSGDGFEPETVYGEYVVGTLFTALGVQPAVGRLIDSQDDQLGAGDPAVAVVSWPYWQNRFDLSPSIVGKRILVDGVPATIIGVTPREFFGLQVGRTPAVWLPAAMEPLIRRPSQRADGLLLGLALMGRLKPGVSIEQARAEMDVLDRWRVEEIAKRSNDPQWRNARIELEAAGAGFAGLRDQFARPLLLLMAIVALLLLIACTNVASMLLARAAARRREIAMRVALGAGRARLTRQLLTESLLLSAAGSVLGVLLAYFGADALARSWPLDTRLWGPQPLELQVHPDLRVLLFTAGIAVLTAVLFGLAPAWTALSHSPASSFRDTGTAGETRSRRLFGQSLIVAQVALSAVLLSTASLFVGHVSNLRNRDIGFQRHSVLLIRLDPARSGYSPDHLSRLYEDLLGRLETIPGVRSATLSAITPIQGPAASRFATVEGFEERPEDRRRLSLNSIAPKYFQTLGTPLVAGRDFQFQDAGRAPVAIVNQSMARYYFGDQNAIGRRITLEGGNVAHEIVGVVGDAKYAEIREAAPRTIYFNAFQEGRGRFSQFALRTDRAPTSVVEDVRRAVADVLKTVPVTRVTTLADQVDAAIVAERLMAKLAGAFGGLGALLAAAGLYGLLAYSVVRRTNEIGVRMALGATRRDVTRMVLKGALGLVCAGLVVGAPIAVWSKRFAASMVENLPVETAFPMAFAAVAMIVVALLAAYVPARRAARVNPIDALRHS